jgi:hypothetical protein
MKRLMMLAAVLAIAATGPAMAGTTYRMPVYNNAGVQQDSNSQLKGGIIAGNGTIVYGKGFQVSHPQTGVYEISFNAGGFKRCPVISVLPAGGAGVLSDLYYYSCNASGVLITVEMENYAGSLEDNAFHFMAVTP